MAEKKEAGLEAFFAVIELCHSLDAEHTDVFRKINRHTTIYVGIDGAAFRVSHGDNGIFTEVMVHLDARDDLKLEIESLHRIINDRLRKQRCMEEEILYVPF